MVQPFSIWAYQIPGTRDVRELEPKANIRDPAFKDYFLNSPIYKIAKFLATYDPENKAGPAFVVVGTGEEALKNANSVFTREKLKQPEKWMPRDTDLSLVFYSYASGFENRITSIELAQRTITVKYQPVTDRQDRFSGGLDYPQFALIPIGKFSEGKVQVEIERLPPVNFRGKPVIPKRGADKHVCDSFSFDVQ